MSKKLMFVLVLGSCLTVTAAESPTESNAVIDLLLNSYSPRAFTNDPLADFEVEQILRCGIKSPSARNRQPWHFTVVRDEPLKQAIIANIDAGNVLIVVAGQEGVNVDFDCALATQSMFIAAQALGLGGRIYTGPVRNVNENLKDALEIPTGYRVVALLRIGHLDKDLDAVTSATPRKPFEETVNYK